MSQCKVYLENYSGTYYAGSEIRGRIECYFDEETTLRAVKLRIKCKEYNSWSGTETYTDPSDNKTKTRHITLQGDHDVIYVEQLLFGSGSGSTVLSRGRHVYPFSYNLPHDIPSTFKGPHGSISFKIKGIVDRPMRFDYEDVFIFVVVSPIDFNRMSKDLQEITTYSDEKTVCCWCCTGGNLTMDVELPKIAFVAGETVPFKVHILNMSNSNVENLHVKFLKTITYRVTSPHSESKEDVDNIVAFVEHGVGAHGEHVYELDLAIPNYVEVPNFDKCTLFSVSYTLQVSAEMPSCTLDLDISVWDIHMGHIQYVDRRQTNEGNKFSLPEVASISPPPVYPPPPVDGAYPPPFPTPYPPPGGPYSPASGAYPPPAGGYPPPNGTFPGPSSDKFVPIPGPPSAPSSSVASAPLDDNPKAREAAASGPPSAPSNIIPELPPPSYNQVQQSAGFIHPSH